MSKKIIRGGTIVTAVDTVLADVLIDGETIAGVGSFDGVDAEVIDATGCFVLPGAIDNHTHLSMPFGGTTTADDYDTGTQAAAAGGTTCLVDFALQMEPNGLRSSLEQWMGRAEGAAHVDYGFHMAITKADAGTFADMAAMVDAGVSTFKVFLAYPNVLMVTDDLFLARARAQQGDRRPRDGARRERRSRSTTSSRRRWRPATPIRSTTRSRGPRSSRPRRPGARSASPSTPARRSTSSTSRASAPWTRSSRRAPAACRPTARPASSTSSRRSTTCAGPDFEGARYVCSPPLRDAANQPHMWDALNYDHLQSISTDHCPFTDEQKRLGFGDFSKIPNGLAAIQHRAAAALGARRQERPHDAEPLRRGDLDGDREDLRPLPEQGHDRARRGRRHRDLRPRTASTSSRRRRRS